MKTSIGYPDTSETKMQVFSDVRFLKLWLQ